MAASTFSSREFNQYVGRAKKAAHKGPVFITERGRYAHVLLTYEDFLRLGGKQTSIVDKLALPEAQDIDFDPPRVDDVPRPAEFD